HDVQRHGGVDLAGQLDEAGVQAVFAGGPGQVKWVNRDAVAAQPWPRVKGLEAERLGLGRPNHLPHVDPPPPEHQLQLVHQGDVHRPVRVLQYLARLGDPGARDRHDALDGGLVEGDGQVAADGVAAAYHLGDVPRRVVAVAGVLALRAVGEEEVPA